jgi:hypothetical protein
VMTMWGMTIERQRSYNFLMYILWRGVGEDY